MKYKFNTQSRFDYINVGNPTTSINPTAPNQTWLNSTTGEVFVCTDNTVDANVWRGDVNTVKPYYFPSNEILYSLDLPNADGGYRGIAFDGKNLITSNSTTERIYIHDGISTTVLEELNPPGGNVKDIALRPNGDIILVDYSDDRLYFLINQQAGVYGSFATVDAPMGVTYDYVNDYLIYGDFSPYTMYIYDNISTTLVDSYTLDIQINGLGFDGVNIYVASGAGGYRILDGVTNSALKNVTTADIGISHVTSICFDGDGRLMLLDYTNDKIHVFKNEDEL